MKKFLSFLVATMLLIPMMVPAMDLPTLNRYVDKNLVSINNNCSGTLLSPDTKIVLTANHCIKKGSDTASILQKFWDDNTNTEVVISYEGKVLAQDEKTDTTILKLNNVIGPITVPLQEDIPTVGVALSDYEYLRGTTVWNVGNHLNQWGTVSRGIISAKRYISGPLKSTYSNKFLIQYDGGVAPGASGGALYDDNGVLIGVTSSMYNAGVPFETMGFFVPVIDFYPLAAKACVQLGDVELPKKCAPKEEPKEEDDIHLDDPESGAW